MLAREGLAGAVIEEYALGPSVNLNFFYSPHAGRARVERAPTRAGRRTSKVFVTCPPSALEALRGVPMRLEEAGHIAATMTESMLEKAFDMGERFVAAARRAASPPGIIGPFALQCVDRRPGRQKSSSVTTFRCAFRARRARAIRPTRPIAGDATFRRRANRDGNRDGA